MDVTDFKSQRESNEVAGDRNDSAFSDGQADGSETSEKQGPGGTERQTEVSSSSLLYGIETTPPWYSVLGLALQVRYCYIEREKLINLEP